MRSCVDTLTVNKHTFIQINKYVTLMEAVAATMLLLLPLPW